MIAQLFAGGVAYVLGYAMQDLFSIAGLVNTGFTAMPHKFLSRLYKRFAGEEWNPESFHEANIAKRESDLIKADFYGKEAARCEYERLISLMLIGTTMGPCCTIVAIILSANFVIRCIPRYHTSPSDLLFDGSIAIATLLLSLGFYLLAWLKTMEVTVYVARFEPPSSAATANNRAGSSQAADHQATDSQEQGQE